MDDPLTDRPRRSSRRLLLGTAVMAVVAGAAFNWARLKPKALPPEAAQALWAAEFDQPNGEVLRLSQFQGKPLVLNFWATWCTPCVEEMPLLEAFFQENQSKSWQVVGLAIDQPSAVKRFLKQNPVNYPIGCRFGRHRTGENAGQPWGRFAFYTGFKCPRWADRAKIRKTI